jgi:membrane protease YdiL (CAAX protease family)
MDAKTRTHKIFHFFLTKIVIGIVIIGGLVAMVEWAGNFLDFFHLTAGAKNTLISVADGAITWAAYIVVFRIYEKRKITEFRMSSLGKSAAMGLILGLGLQSFFILVIYLAGDYAIFKINPVGYLSESFAASLKAGFVAEILIMGVIFRLTEQCFGTKITLVFMTMLFALLHIKSKGASVLSVSATALQAGFMLAAAFIATRDLWFPIFIHFSWDFTEPGIFGGTNPGISISQTLFSSSIEGNALITGGPTGPQNSLQAVFCCLVAGMLLLYIGRRRNNFILPFWVRQNIKQPLID